MYPSEQTMWQTPLLSFSSDGGDFITVCKSFSETVSRAGEDPGNGASLPGT